MERGVGNSAEKLFALVRLNGTLGFSTRFGEEELQLPVRKSSGGLGGVLKLSG